MYFTFVVLCLVGTAFAHSDEKGVCPDVEVQQNFNMSKYLGTWFIAATFNADDDVNYNCGTIAFFADGNRTFTLIDFTLHSTGEKMSGNYTCCAPDNSVPAKLKLKLPSSPCHVSSRNDVLYWVLGTDYKSFAVMYTCEDSHAENTRSRLSVLLTRERKANASVIGEADKVIEKNGLDKSKFVKTDQTGCKP